MTAAPSIPGYDPTATAGKCWFDKVAAQNAVDFFHECLHFTEGEWAGDPFKLEPWQHAIVWNLFGWKRPDGTRRYREALIYVAKKNGKTMFCGGLANLVAFADNEPAAHVYIAAADREQARLAFGAAKGQVESEPELSKRANVYRNSIVIPSTGSSIKVVSAEAYTKHGPSLHCVIIDELHAQRSRDLVDVLQGATAARRQPLTIYITTADFDRESICNEKYAYACKVRDGVIEDPSFLPVIYEAKPDDDYADPKVWAKANPNLGVSLKMEFMERECKRAKETPSYENTFKRLHLNMRTQQDVRWLTLEAWDACSDSPVIGTAATGVTYSAHIQLAEELQGRSCWAGLDMSSTQDLTAFVMVFPDGDGGYKVLPHFWAPSDGAKRREIRDRVPYETWGRQGLIELVPGKSVDYDRVRTKIIEYGRLYDIRDIAIDRWNATQIATQLQGDGFEVVLFGQGYASMSAPAKELEKLVITEKFNHGGNPILRWMASHVAIETDAAGNIKPSKAKSTDRIDGIVAAVMALGRAMVSGESDSVYSTRGLLVI